MSELIHRNTSILDIVAAYQSTEDVFRSYDEAAGTCILCNHLFETPAMVCEKYGFDLANMLEKLQRAARSS